MSTKHCFLLLLTIGLGSFVGCGNPELSSTTVTDKATATEEATASLEGDEVAPTPRERAIQARDELFQRLSAELVAAISSGGPASAIAICQQKAPKLAVAVGEKYGVSMGRTSFKLRNPQNIPPMWAEPLIEQRVEEPTFVELEDQQTGALLPIRLQPQCLVCHGSTEQIPEEVRTQLQKLYPGDDATGFDAGDLRGWFWVTVPASDSAEE